MPIWNYALPRAIAPTTRILDVVMRMWATMTANPAMAGVVLSAGLRADRVLGSKERPVAADMLLGMIRHEQALRRIAGDPVEAWLALATGGCPDLPDPEDPVAAYAIAVSVPEALARQWWERLGEERALSLARTLAGRAPMWLRVLSEPVEVDVAHERFGAALRVDGRANIEATEFFRAGRAVVQDLGSQRVVEAAFAGEKCRVLDLCAGAGGKSLALAAMGAEVTAWDTRGAALDELDRRARRSKLDVRIAEPSGTYDVILIDAPCSGSGVLRRHPENRWKLRYFCEEQRGLLARSRGRAGRVVYATCSLAREENEEIVGVEGTTLWPEERGSEGYFWAVLA